MLILLWRPEISLQKTLFSRHIPVIREEQGYNQSLMSNIHIIFTSYRFFKMALNQTQGPGLRLHFSDYPFQIWGSELRCRITQSTVYLFIVQDVEQNMQKWNLCVRKQSLITKIASKKNDTFINYKTKHTVKLRAKISIGYTQSCYLSRLSHYYTIYTHYLPLLHTIEFGSFPHKKQTTLLTKYNNRLEQTRYQTATFTRADIHIYQVL